MFKYLALILVLISSPLYAQSSHVKSDFISAPDKAYPGQMFQVGLQGDVPYTITGKPFQVREDVDRHGNIWLLITAGNEDIKIDVDFSVVHPTKEEVEKAPDFTSREDLLKWLDSHSKDEIYFDSHTVYVSGEPGPGPDPGPDPDPTPNLTEFSKQVRNIAQVINKPADAKKIIENYSSILSAIEAGAYNEITNFVELRGKIVADIYNLNKDISDKDEKWKKFFESLVDLVDERKVEIDDIDDIKTLFKEVKMGLEASL